MADYGLKITKDTKDITSTEPRDYVFNSAYGSVKVYSEPPNKTYQTIAVNDSSTATVSVEHGLPFVPMVMWFTELTPGSGHWYMGGLVLKDPADTAASVTMNGDADSATYVDSTYIKVKYHNSSGSNLTVKYYYFIFADNGS